MGEILKALEEGDMKKIRQFLDAVKDFGHAIEPFLKSRIEAYMERANTSPKRQLKALKNAMKRDDVSELKDAIATYEKQQGDDKATLHIANLILHLLQALKDDSSADRLEGALRPLLDLKQEDYGHGDRAASNLMKQYEKALCEAYYQRSLPALEQAVKSVQTSCLAAHLQQQLFYTRAVKLQTQLQHLQRVMRDVHKLTSQELAALVNTRSKPNPHLHSTLMATLTLLSEEERELWEWSKVQNLLQRKSEFKQQLVEIDYSRVKVEQAKLAAHHVHQCQVDLLRKESSACAALLLEWVQVTTEEICEREAMRGQMKQTTNVTQAR